ncbi:MAG: helix-turn-helix transcriptional regulator, partial [Gracilibacteraceae bacterium]|nr:helix-turn-helix transcriptional regulator [Gracilibacteraceae bacterium]
SYKKLWKLLIDLEINKSALAKMTGIGNSTLTKLTKGDNVNMNVLVRICEALNCNLFDVVELLPDKTEKNDTAGGETNERQ